MVPNHQTCIYMQARKKWPKIGEKEKDVQVHRPLRFGMAEEVCTDGAPEGSHWTFESVIQASMG